MIKKMKTWEKKGYRGSYPRFECSCDSPEWSWDFNSKGFDHYTCLGCGRFTEIDRNPPKKLPKSKPLIVSHEPDPEPEEKIIAFFPKNKNDTKAGAIYINEEGFCEHCMELEPFNACISDGGTNWCINCFECDENNIISPDVMKEIMKRQYKLQKKYYTKKLKELE